MSLTNIPFSLRIDCAARFYEYQYKTRELDWLEILFDLEKNDSYGLPELLVLLNPKFYPSLNANDPRGDRNYASVANTFKCRSAEIWGYECKFTGAPIHVDHMFPYSKGGATHGQNAMHLCDEHNLVKHTDIHLIPWENLPFNNDWINQSVKVLFNYASRKTAEKIYLPLKQISKL
jgi:hypothetical protein